MIAQSVAVNPSQAAIPSTSHQLILEKDLPCPRKVVPVCPSVEDLRLKSPTPCLSAPLRCPVAGCRAFSFKRQAYLIQHMNAVHPHLSPYKGGSAKDKGKEYHYHCPQADCVYSSQLQQRWFSTLDQLRYHYVNTHDEKRFACAKCGKLFGWQRDRDHHEKECGRTFPCGTCPARYPCRRSLLTHCMRKQHPVPAQFEKPARKAKGSNSATPSVQVQTSTASQSVAPLAVPTQPSAVSHAVPSQPSTASQSMPTQVLTASQSIPTPSAVPIQLSTVSQSIVTPSLVPSSSTSVQCSVGVSVHGGLPVVCSAAASSAGSGPPQPPLAASSSVTAGVSLKVSAAATTPSGAAQPSAVAVGGPQSSSYGISTSLGASGTAFSRPGAAPLRLAGAPVSLGGNGAVVALSLTDGASGVSLALPSSAGGTPSVSDKVLSAEQSSLPLHASDAASGVAQFSDKTWYALPASVSSGNSSLPASVSGAIPAFPQSLSSSLVSVSSSSALQGEDRASTLSRADGSVPDTGVTQTQQAQHSWESGSSAEAGDEKHCVRIVSKAQSRATQSAYIKKKFRPILPKSERLVVIGMGPSAAQNSQGHGLVTQQVPWIGQRSMAAENAVGKSEAETGDGSRGETGSGGSSSVVHMGTQVSEGALHPLPTCHTATQVWGWGGGALRAGGSTHTAVQTCNMQTAHSATQLSAPLDGAALRATAARGGEEGRQVCATVAIQTSGQVEVTNMAIQATGQFPAPGSSLMVDMVDPRNAQPEIRGSYVVGSALGTHTASQTSFPYILLNKSNSTSTTGTQVVTAATAGGEESDVASRGMQTSVTLIHRPKLGAMMAAQTQTSSSSEALGEEEAAGQSPHFQSRAWQGSRARKRSTRSSEVQTCTPRTKRGRRRRRGEGGDALQGGHVQEISTQTLTHTPEHQAHHDVCGATASRKSPREKSKSGKTGSGKRTKGKEQRRRAATSPDFSQNPPLSVSAAREGRAEVWDPFLASPGLAPDSPAPGDLDLFSQELGVQTPQDFLSALTADFGVQTMGQVLSTTADLAVQTLDLEQEQRCTADLGVQTMTSVLGSLLDNLDADLGSLEEAAMMVPTLSSTSSEADPGHGLVTECTSSAQSRGVRGLSEESDLQLDAASFPSGAAHRLFDSFDSDLSFSDCGTGTEDFFASTHTQTTGGGPTLGDHDDHSALSSFSSSLSGMEDAVPHPHPQKKAGAHASEMDLLLTDEAGSLSGEADLVDFCRSPPAPYPGGAGAAAAASRPTSSSTTDTDLLSGAPAMDSHTQTADDLLLFLMNNMETQTTEELLHDHHHQHRSMEVTDTHTQTSSCNVLSTPPHHPMFSSPGREEGGFPGGWEGVASAETQTQTSGQLWWDLPHDQEDLFDLADMETQTMLW